MMTTHRKSWFVAVLITAALLYPEIVNAEETSSDSTNIEDSEEGRRLVHPRNQVPAIRNGGILNAGETAYSLYLDGQLFPPAMMMSVQHGLSYWITLGLDIGGGIGSFQALLRIRMENLPPLANHRFFWGFHMRTGFKYHDIDLAENLAFEDLSYVVTLENTFSVRLGSDRRHILYLDTIGYFDIDITRRDRRTDYYLIPAMLGYERVIEDRWNFFIEVGVLYSFNGTETKYGVLYENSWFPVGTLGFGYRQRGPRSALDTF